MCRKFSFYTKFRWSVFSMYSSEETFPQMSYRSEKVNDWVRLRRKRHEKRWWRQAKNKRVFYHQRYVRARLCLRHEIADTVRPPFDNREHKKELMNHHRNNANAQNCTVTVSTIFVFTFFNILFSDDQKWLIVCTMRFFYAIFLMWYIEWDSRFRFVSIHDAIRIACDI